MVQDRTREYAFPQELLSAHVFACEPVEPRFLLSADPISLALHVPVSFEERPVIASALDPADRGAGRESLHDAFAPDKKSASELMPRWLLRLVSFQQIETQARDHTSAKSGETLGVVYDSSTSPLQGRAADIPGTSSGKVDVQNMQPAPKVIAWFPDTVAGTDQIVFASKEGALSPALSPTHIAKLEPRSSDTEFGPHELRSITGVPSLIGVGSVFLAGAVNDARDGSLSAWESEQRGIPERPQHEVQLPPVLSSARNVERPNQDLASAAAQIASEPKQSWISNREPSYRAAETGKPSWEEPDMLALTGYPAPLTFGASVPDMPALADQSIVTSASSTALAELQGIAGAAVGIVVAGATTSRDGRKLAHRANTPRKQ